MERRARLCRADRRDRGLPALPAAGRVARAGRPREGRPLPRRDLLGPAGARVRRSGRADPARRARARGARRQPDGRVFTGDASGDFLFAALHAVGLANQPTCRRADDGLTLTDAYIAAAVRCAPPANKPTPDERDTCQPFLVRELALLDGGPGARRARRVRLGRASPGARGARPRAPRPRPRFGHGAEAAVGPYVVLGSYHPSQQNTFTGKLTPPMLRAVLRAGTGDPPTSRGQGDPTLMTDLPDPGRSSTRPRRRPIGGVIGDGACAFVPDGALSDAAASRDLRSRRCRRMARATRDRYRRPSLSASRVRAADPVSPTGGARAPATSSSPGASPTTAREQGPTRIGTGDPEPPHVRRRVGTPAAHHAGLAAVLGNEPRRALARDLDLGGNAARRTGVHLEFGKGLRGATRPWRRRDHVHVADLDSSIELDKEGRAGQTRVASGHLSSRRYVSTTT